MLPQFYTVLPQMENVDPSSISTQSLVYKTYVENVTEAREGVEQKNNSSYY